MNRAYFTKMGTYDRGMDIWGGENLEISFRVCNTLIVEENRKQKMWKYYEKLLFLYFFFFTGFLVLFDLQFCGFIVKIRCRSAASVLYVHHLRGTDPLLYSFQKGQRSGTSPLASEDACALKCVELKIIILITCNTIYQKRLFFQNMYTFHTTIIIIFKVKKKALGFLLLQYMYNLYDFQLYLLIRSGCVEEASRSTPVLTSPIYSVP